VCLKWVHYKNFSLKKIYYWSLPAFTFKKIE
jgi:hypothetical protein